MRVRESRREAQGGRYGHVPDFPDVPQEVSAMVPASGFVAFQTRRAAAVVSRGFEFGATSRFGGASN